MVTSLATRLTGTYTYFPPTVNDVPPVDADVRGPRYRLFRHYGTRPRGENVWQLLDGTWTTVQPFPTVSVTDALTQTSDAPATYIKVFWGGHIYDRVSPDDAAALQAAGLATLDVNLFANRRSLPPHLLLLSSGQFLYLRGSDGVLCFSPITTDTNQDLLITSDGQFLYLTGSSDTDILTINLSGLAELVTETGDALFVAGEGDTVLVFG